MEEFLLQYGYIVLFIGTFLEGETILLIAGYMASTGVFSLPYVILAAFLGTFFGDQLYFFIGYRWGDHVLKRANATWLARAARVKRLLHRYDAWFILSFRFFYGIRNVTPFVLGMMKINPVRYVLLNALAAFVWAMSFGWSGYLFGNAVEAFLGEMKTYESYILGALVFVAVAIWGVRKLRNGRAQPVEQVEQQAENS